MINGFEELEAFDRETTAAATETGPSAMRDMARVVRGVGKAARQRRRALLSAFEHDTGAGKAA